MKIKIYPISSSLHSSQAIGSATKKLIDELKSDSRSIEIENDINKLYTDTDLSLILIQTGGSENIFLENFAKLKEPYYLLTYGTNNSLAASLEILAYLNNHHLEGEILHGSKEYLISRISSLSKNKNLIQCGNKLGVIGKPSDWLISSAVNYQAVQEKFNFSLIDIDISEVENTYKSIKDDFKLPKFSSSFNNSELRKAYRFYLALEQIVNKYELKGFTIRCFDLLTSLKTTACLALSIFNSKQITATCEGDIPSLISMHIANTVFNTPTFQANPAKIDIATNTMVLAHCTLPLSMCSSYKFDTHFESNIGVGIHGELNLEDITVFRINSSLSEAFVEEGKILSNQYKNNMCRTQIEIELPNLDKLLFHPLGNHLSIIYKDRKNELVSFFKDKGIKVI